MSHKRLKMTLGDIDMSVTLNDMIKFGTLHNNEIYELSVKQFIKLWNEFWKHNNNVFLGTISECFDNLLNDSQYTNYDVAQLLINSDLVNFSDVDIENDHDCDLYGMTVYNDVNGKLSVELVKCNDNDLFDFIESNADTYDLSDFLLYLINNERFSSLDMKIVNIFIYVMQMYV